MILAAIVDQGLPENREGKSSVGKSQPTIVALSSGGLPAGVAIVRASGSAVPQLMQSFAGSLPEARRAEMRTLRLHDGSVLDRGLVLYFPGPGSFTGEDCAEFHVHGGRAVVAALLQALCRVEGVRLAEAGEFTRRAFANGKMDLLETESLADLIGAETESERRFAIENGTGRHARLYAGWREEIIRARAMIEAQLDFVDEDDVPDALEEAVWSEMAGLEQRILEHLSGHRRAEMICHGFDVVLLGAPNVGKSSLLNALAQREAAIVTDEPGTTRDLVEIVLDLEGSKVRITDTAGVRVATGKVERIGIERALERARNADLILALMPADGSADSVDPPAGPPVLRVATKIDSLSLLSGPRPACDHAISVLTGVGLPELLLDLGERARAASLSGNEVVPWKERHVALLQEAAARLHEAVHAAAAGLELRAESLRAASQSLGRIAGEVDVEDLLDAIFGTFCIGK